MLTFQTVLREAGLVLKDVRLLRHAKGGGTPGIHPLVAWRDDPERFERYQAFQAARRRRFFGAPFWASFVALRGSDSLFVGVYAATLQQTDLGSFTCPLTGRIIPEREADSYLLKKLPEFARLEGKLIVDWGGGTLAWAQLADKNPKQIVELRRQDGDPPYPGHSAFVRQLSEIASLPASWRAILSAVRGVYLLTCPRTREQYVGGAYSNGGFIARWEQHARMQGDAIAFRARDPADYRVSILEVAGSLMADDEVQQMEQRWKEKLQSREMGLNRN
jgi:hypothetical protein